MWLRFSASAAYATIATNRELSFICGQLAEAEPDNHDRELTLATAYHGAAAILSDLGNEAMAECYKQQALAMFKRLADLEMATRDFQNKLVFYCAAVAMDLEHSGWWSEARRCYEIAEQIAIRV